MQPIDLAAESLGGYALAANEGCPEPLLRDTQVWQTRRRPSGNDWCVVRLAVPGVLQEVVVDTTGCDGNFPPECSIEGCVAPHNARVEQLDKWVELVPRSPLQGGHWNLFGVRNAQRFSHVRLNIFPDGAVARLHVHGQPVPDWMRSAPISLPLDVAALLQGGRVDSCSDQTYGDVHSLNLPGSEQAWQTRRRREPGEESAILHLATSAMIQAIQVETGKDAPLACRLEGRRSPSEEWTPLLERQQLLPHTLHSFSDEIRAHGGVEWVRLSIEPDGGVARLRLWGLPDAAGREAARLRWLNSLSARAFEKEMHAVCTSGAWAQGLARRRPFRDLRQLVESSHKIWDTLTESDWLEAFAGHPRIGAKKAPGQGQTSQAWSAQEQAQVTEHQEELATGNRDYEQKFGFVFLICATGKSSQQILSELQRRIGCDRAEEVRAAAAEQAKINALRLEKYLQR